MARVPKIAPEDRDRIRAEFIEGRKNGIPVKVLCRRYGISAPYFHMIIKDQKFVLTVRTPSNRERED